MSYNILDTTAKKLVTALNQGGGGGTGKETYTYNFQEQNWELIDNLYALTITVSQHSLGMRAYVLSVEKLENPLYLNTMFSYSRESNGTLIIYSDFAFNGRAILQEE